jgi:fructokinase
VDTVVPPAEDWDFLFKAAPFIDCLKCNQHEARSVTGKTDMKAALTALEKLGIPLTVISLAEKGLLLSYNGVRYGIPPFAIKSADATGAGDAFMAGVIAKLSQSDGCELNERIGASEERLLDTAVFASACGAQAVTARGCLAGAEKSAVLELLRGQEERVRAGIESF